MTDTPPSNPAPNIPQSPPFSPWWLFVFGVMVGYVVFRPGGVRDYFLASGAFRDTMTVGASADRALAPEMPMAPQWGGAAAPGGVRGDRFGSNREAGGGAAWDERSRSSAGVGAGYPPVQDGFEDDSVQGGRDRDIQLPPTDLFTDNGSNSRGMGGVPF